jgi:hypothetical protein
MEKTRHSFVALALLPLGLAGIIPGVDTRIGAQRADAQIASARVLTLDVAADCRTVVAGLNRGDPNIVTGKIFPGGTLPQGNADNDPTLPVNGVAAIGDWHHRSQNALPLPPDIAGAYPSTPPVLATFYFFFDDGDALVSENWGIIEVDGIPIVPGVITGGYGRFSGAAGDSRNKIIGTNATGCPNSTGRFNIRPSSVRGGGMNK